MGKPKDGDPRGCYAILTLDGPISKGSKGMKVEFVRFEYDVERAAKPVKGQRTAKRLCNGAENCEIR